MQTNNMNQELKLQPQQILSNEDNIKEIVDTVISQSLNEHESNSNEPQSQGQAIKKIILSIKEDLEKKIYEHNQNVRDKDNVPTIEDTQACVRMLQAQFPMLKIDLIVKVLHDMFHLPCDIAPEDSREDTLSISVDHEVSPTTKSIPTDYTIVNSRVRAKESVNIPIDPRMSEEKRVAISYLNFGYGVRILRDYINDPSMNPTKYNNIITSIMKMSFRKLEEFIRGMGKAIVAINSMEEKIIRAPLTNCEKWMPPDQLEVFYKLIKYATGLDQRLDIQPQTAVKLYNSCIRQLQQRQANEAEFKRRQRRDKRGHRERIEYQSGGFLGEPKIRDYDRHYYAFPYPENRAYKSPGYNPPQRAPLPYGRYVYDQVHPDQPSRTSSSDTRYWQSLSQQSRYQLKSHPYKQDYSNYTTY